MSRKKSAFEINSSTLGTGNPLHNVSHAGEIFRLSLEFRKLVSSLQMLRVIYSGIEARTRRQKKADLNLKEMETYISFSKQAEMIFQKCGDQNPVELESIADWFSSESEDLIDTTFSRRINACGNFIDRALGTIPPSLTKAYLGARESFLFQPTLPLAAVLSRKAEGQDLANLVDACNPKTAMHPDDPLTAIFLLDLIDNRDPKLRVIIEELRQEALFAASNASDTDPRLHSLPIPGQTHWLLHTTPRRPQLRLPLFSPMRAWVHSLVPFQTSDGYWFTSNDQNRPLVFTSAGIAHCLAIFGNLRNETYRAAYNNALSWLESTQMPDGGWPKTSGEEHSDILTTALTADLLRRAGQVRPFQRAVSFLFKLQHSAGLWYSGHKNSDAFNAIVLEVLEERLHVFPPSDHKLEIARGLFAKAEELAREKDEIADQVALITAHQAAEMLSYSVLEALDPPGDIWEPNGRTIGLRVALARLDERLRQDGGGALRFRSQVQSLAAARDEIVHKGGTSSRSAVDSHLDAARSYMTSVSLRLLGYDLLG